MKLRIFTLRFSDSLNGFDDQVIQDFQVGREVVEVKDHFFIHEKMPILTVLISYRDIEADEKRKTDSPSRRVDPRGELDAMEREIYDALRAWRAARAKQEGFPPYVIANNKQLAKAIKLRVDSKSELLKIEGFGEAKAEQYGDEMLGILNGLDGTPQEPESTPSVDTTPEKDES